MRSSWPRFVMLAVTGIMIWTALTGCGSAAKPTQAPAAAPTKAPEAATPTAGPASKASVGVVLPTKDEPRWPQDRAVFQKAGSMTVLKDVRTLAADAITAANAYLAGGTPPKRNSYNNGKIDVPAQPSAIVAVTKENVKQALIDSGYCKPGTSPTCSRS